MSKAHMLVCPECGCYPMIIRLVVMPDKYDVECGSYEWEGRLSDLRLEEEQHGIPASWG
jgi:hypothetical protein